MDYLWTPWRSTYLEENKVRDRCVFCQAVQDAARDRENLVAYRGLRCFIILNRYPYTTGHLMIVPYLHVSKLASLENDASDELMNLVRKSETVLEDAYRPDGMNIGMNLGTAAGAGIAGHLHMHVLPRWSGDANFMTTVGNARILPESLEQTYDKIARGFGK